MIDVAMLSWRFEAVNAPGKPFKILASAPNPPIEQLVQTRIPSLPAYKASWSDGITGSRAFRPHPQGAGKPASFNITISPMDDGEQSNGEP